ncbi:outer membrane family protein [Helicobacter pylori]|nr:outer membrane family protein [Helicobacter pylori]
MNAQELIKKSALIEKTLQEQGLQEKAKPFMSENAVITTEELEKTLKEMQAEDRDLKVGIIGRVKAGKSSLLNALIFEGVEVLPKAATPMTASLTILKYAQNLSTEVEFYSPKDIAELENEHERYVREFNRIVGEEVNKQKEKQSLSNRAKERVKSFSNKFSRNKSTEAAPKERVLSDEEILEKARRIAKNTLKGDEKLVSSYDQYERMKKSGLLNTEKLDPRIQANSLQELNQKLLQFVGTNGKFMPYTKAVQISLNNPNLKDLEVIDTPGVNDPIASREERTKALLKDCDVVFIISPSNQFLTDSDMSLFDRVSNKEGLQEIYDTKDDTPYEDAYSNFYNANSITINAFVGKSIKNLLVQLYGKLTYSPRADSQSLGVTLKYNIKKHIYLMLTLNGYQITMHKGYKVGFFTSGYNPDFAQTIQNRSYLMSSMSYRF